MPPPIKAGIRRKQIKECPRRRKIEFGKKFSVLGKKSNNKIRHDCALQHAITNTTIASHAIWTCA